MQPLVDFIGIGVQKAATSWLFECFFSHPNIATPGLSNKELNFFTGNYEKGYSWYHAHFPEGYRRTGEYSPLYFHDADAPDRIRRYRSDARLLLSLRNPIDRAFSQHLHEVRRGRLPEDLYGFWAAEAQNPTYVEQGLYAGHLARWLEHFDASQLHVILYDDIEADPAHVFAAVCMFLDVPEVAVPEIGLRTNVSVRHRSAAFNQVLRQSGKLVQRVAGDRGFRVARRTGLPRRVRSLNQAPVKEAEVPRLSLVDRDRLYDLFTDDISRLESMICRDLSGWR